MDPSAFSCKADAGGGGTGGGAVEANQPLRNPVNGLGRGVRDKTGHRFHWGRCVLKHGLARVQRQALAAVARGDVHQGVAFERHRVGRRGGVGLIPAWIRALLPHLVQLPLERVSLGGGHHRKGDGDPVARADRVKHHVVAQQGGA